MKCVRKKNDTSEKMKINVMIDNKIKTFVMKKIRISTFYKWHRCRRSRHMPTTSVSHGFGRLNRSGGTSSSGHQSHHSKGGGSSPETSGDGLVHPRVGLPRFGDR